MLTNAAVKAARPKSRAYKMFDERGLHLFIAPTGLKAWRLKCRVQGREKLLSLGRYPEISLAEAREGADRTREAIAAARDPSVAPAADFETVARDWHAHRRPRWSDRHASDVLTSLERDVFSALGGKPLGAIDPVAVLTLIQSIEARGARETARRVRQRLDNIFAFAIARMLTDRNPAAAIAGELTAGEAGQRRHPALLDLDEARGLITAAELLPAPAIVRQASLFLALTAVRMTSLLSATWAEIEHLDEADVPRAKKFLDGKLRANGL
jgi:integrase